MKALKIGPVEITFHRTVRVKQEGVSTLPPSLGIFPLYRVSEYKKNCPEEWENDAVFIPLHEEEALWMNFQTITPVAILIGAGGINALTGEKLTLKLEEENYVVCPPQPWLDGWKDKTGCVYQFVTTEYKKGEGKSVGEQILKKEVKAGGIGIAVYEAKDPERLSKQFRPTGVFCCAGSSIDYEEPCAEIGVGKGGKIDQKIYPDPHGIKEWKEDPTAVTAVYLINGPQFAKITGHKIPPLPPDFKEYYGNWYGLKDKHLDDVQGTDKFDDLKMVCEE